MQYAVVIDDKIAAVAAVVVGDCYCSHCMVVVIDAVLAAGKKEDAAALDQRC